MDLQDTIRQLEIEKERIEITIAELELAERRRQWRHGEPPQVEPWPEVDGVRRT